VLYRVQQSSAIIKIIFAYDNYIMNAQGLERVKDVAGKLICVPLSPGVVATELNTMKGCPPADKWAATAAPFILNIPPEHNGYSVCVPNYYSTEYMSTWIIPPNSPLPSNVVRPK